MKEKKRIQNNDVIRAIAGDGFHGVAIDNDYFARERRENAIEQGYPTVMPELVGTDMEYIIRRSDKLVTELEHERCPRYTNSYPYDDDYREIWYPSMHITRIQL